MGKPYTLEEIEKQYPDGHLDADDFYFSKDEKTFFDPWGYRFDLAEDGEYYDEYGGYYDDYGYYIPAEQYQQEYY